jgi:ribosomal-protein-alanine N-acetyltransferase
MRSKRTKQPGSHFTAVWEFHVPTNKRRAFEKAYRPNGDWASLFRRGEGYIRTELIRDPATPGRYVTLDFWTSRLAYQRFKGQNVPLYKALDKRCEMLTQSERLIGEFEKAVPARLIWPGASADVAADNTRIRPATAADIPAIIAIERSSESAAHWSESAYHDIFRSVAVRISLVSEHGHGSLVGFVIARIGGGDCEIENIAVADSMQRRGVGSELVNGLKEEAQRRDIARIFLEVRESNTAARALYKKCGFQIIGRRNSYYGSPAEDAIQYALTNV